MGCVSSKLFKQQHLNEEQELIITHTTHNHVISLTSTSYGLLNLNSEVPVIFSDNAQPSSSPEKKNENAEVINAWELMEGLEEAMPVKKSSPKPLYALHGFANFDRTPLKTLNQFGSPMKGRRSEGKENKERRFNTPKGGVKSNIESDKSCKKALNMSPVVKGSPFSAQRKSLGSDSSRRKSISPWFDPEMVDSYEKEISKEKEQIKRVVLPSSTKKTPRKLSYSLRDSEAMLKIYEEKRPPGGENAVVIYTTTLRGIRKTFEDCNNVRGIVESHVVRVLERDISMDSGFKEEIRELMGSKKVRVPLVFVKGRLIGGADEIVKLEEEGKLEALFDGIPKARVFGCQSCGGMRFVMCVMCNGSCKVRDEGEKKMVKCGECNENGLIHCPFCC